MKTFSPELLQDVLNGILQSLGWQEMSAVSKASGAKISLVVAFSGGVDSVVLLHALSSLLSTESTDPFSRKNTSPDFDLSAIHVNHQLQPQADEWQSFCIAFCEKLNIPIKCVVINASPVHDEGPEAAARNARYAAFKRCLGDNDILLTGHHLDDQIETVFLHMLRGTGVSGAAGIRPVSDFQSSCNSTYLARPMLRFSREQIEAYANAQNLLWVEDPSNHESHYDRNFLRHNVLPVIATRWPSYRQTINRFSQNMVEARALFHEIAVQDFKHAFDARESTLDIDVLRELSLPRLNNVLRYWLNKDGYSMPGEKQLSQIRAAITAKPDASPLVRWANAEVRRFKNKLYSMPQLPLGIDKNTVIKIANWQPGQEVVVPGYGVLTLEAANGDGLKLSSFSSQQIEIRFRQGGERCKPAGRNKPQALKKVFQEKHIPPWRRDNSPLLFIDNEIAAVVGLFYCSPFACDDEDGVVIVRVQHKHYSM